METDQENEEEEESDGALDGGSDFEGIEDMSDGFRDFRRNCSLGCGLSSTAFRLIRMRERSWRGNSK
ncbi:hypothetical protein TB1_008615 [Malus domestica]